MRRRPTRPSPWAGPWAAAIACATPGTALSNLVVSDNRTGVIVSPVTTLAPGASVDLASSYVVQESNLPGPLVNGVSASARTALNQPVSAAGRHRVVLTTGPAIQIVVTASPSPANIGQVVTFNYTSSPTWGTSRWTASS